MTAPSFRPVYVCGCMRSGTTILHKVLCQSPDANAFAPAARYLLEQVRLYARFAGPDGVYIDDHFGGQEAFRAFTSDLLGRVLERAWDVAGRPAVMVMKSPELSPFVPIAAGLLGAEARFVFSVREPKDVVASMIRVGERQRADGLDTMLSRAGRDIDALCQVYLGAYAPVLRALSDVASPLRGRVLFATYEDLAADPLAALARIAGFCVITPGDLPGEGGWPAGESAAKLAEHPRWRTYITALSDRPVSADSVGAHARVLSGEEAARVDERCARLRQTFGYR